MSDLRGRTPMNPLTVERSRLRELVVLETIEEGESVYRRGAAAAD